jgi:hypothetical protein
MDIFFLHKGLQILLNINLYFSQFIYERRNIYRKANTALFFLLATILCLKDKRKYSVLWTK